MTHCAKCKKRKAKRSCSALGDHLCNLCCGLLREKEIHCPPNCAFLKPHKSYQEKKVLEKKPAAGHLKDRSGEDILKDERMSWLALHIEAPLKDFGEKRPDFADRDAILALEYAKDKILKGKSLIVFPGQELIPKNLAGEAVYRNIENCRYERKILLAGETGTYKEEEKIRCLDRLILSAKHLSKDRLDGRVCIEHLIGQFKKIEELSQNRKILTPP